MPYYYFDQQKWARERQSLIEEYQRREKEEQAIWEKLAAEAHIICTRPERVIDKRQAIFARWQRLRRARLLVGDLPPHSKFNECACGSYKAQASEYCFDCRDMLKIIRQRFFTSVHVPPSFSRTELHVCPMPPRTSQRWRDEMLADQENAIRILEDG